MENEFEPVEDIQSNVTVKVADFVWYCDELGEYLSVVTNVKDELVIDLFVFSIGALNGKELKGIGYSPDGKPYTWTNLK